MRSNNTGHRPQQRPSEVQVRGRRPDSASQSSNSDGRESVPPAPCDATPSLVVPSESAGSSQDNKLEIEPDLVEIEPNVAAPVPSSAELGPDVADVWAKFGQLRAKFGRCGRILVEVGRCRLEIGTHLPDSKPDWPKLVSTGTNFGNFGPSWKEVPVASILVHIRALCGKTRACAWAIIFRTSGQQTCPPFCSIDTLCVWDPRSPPAHVHDWHRKCSELLSPSHNGRTCRRPTPSRPMCRAPPTARAPRAPKEARGFRPAQVPPGQTTLEKLSNHAKPKVV